MQNTTKRKSKETAADRWNAQIATDRAAWVKRGQGLGLDPAKVDAFGLANGNVALRDMIEAIEKGDALRARFGADRDASILEIAKEHLDLETLETRNSDGLDFSDQAVWGMRHALEAAYAAGAAAAKGAK